MISGLVLKYLNGEYFVIRRGYETTLPVSTSFCLTVPSEELKYTFRHEYSKFGKELWPDKSKPSLEQTPGQQNYIRISNNLYHWGRGIFKHIIYIDFEKPKFYEITSFGPALRGLEQTSRKLDGNNRMLEIPVTVWDCKRLD